MTAGDVWLLVLAADGIAIGVSVCIWVLDHLFLAEQRLARIEWIIASDYGDPTDPDPGEDEPLAAERTNVVAIGRRAA